MRISSDYGILMIKKKCVLADKRDSLGKMGLSGHSGPNL